MPSRQAETGHAGRPGNLPMAMDLNILGGRGTVTIEIDEGDHAPRINRHQIRHWASVAHTGDHGEAGRVLKFLGDGKTVSGEPHPMSGIVGLEPESSRAREGFDSYKPRIEYLRGEAKHDGYELRGDSEADFRQFVLSRSDTRRGNLVLIDNGNLRAVWKDEQGSHLGLQFLGGGMVQYVIFKQRGAERQISRVAGRDSFDGIFRQIKVFDLSALLYQ